MSQVLVVEASAGSGKTYEIARRYVQLCLNLAVGAYSLSPGIQSILCVTFTNKAAWEMKTRILDCLKRIALKQLRPCEVQDILEPLGLDELEASQRAFKIMNEIIRQYHYFQVQTIDSFINVLLVGCSFKIGLSARFKLQRNTKEYLQLALDELLAETEEKKNLRALFEDFIKQYLFLENRLGWFPKEDLLSAIYELFKQYNIYQKPLLVYSTQQDLFAGQKRIQALMAELKSLMPAETNKRFREHLESLLKEKDHVLDVDALKSYWASEEFPINKGGRITQEIQELWQKLHSEIHDLCWLQAHSLFNLHVLLFKELLRSFNHLSQRDDVLFLEELNRRVSTLFEKQLVTVEELYFRLCARYRHYLVDEFQDTSLSQWRNLAPMVQEALSCGGSLFYVGDKKQAIYAFRGGESRLFDALQSQLKDFNVTIKNLDKNYRSLPEIVAFNNKVFSLENLRDFLDRRRTLGPRHQVDFSEDDFDVLSLTFGHAHQLPVKLEAKGVVRVTYLQDGRKTERMQEVHDLLIPLVKALRKRFSLKDIAILTRGNEEVEEITRWLFAEGILVQSERTSDIKSNPLIAELIYFLTFLSSPLDNNAFAQFCLGEICPKATGLSKQTLQDFLFDGAKRTKQRQGGAFYQHFQERFPGIWQSFFEEFFNQVGICPLYELTAGIIERFGLGAHFPEHQGFFMHLLELIRLKENESCALSYFLNFYETFEGEERFVAMSQINAVRVLTVHKAKGLEFPVVVVPFLEMDVKVDSYLVDIQEEGIGFIRIKETYRTFCPELHTRYAQEYKESFLEELNSVYVALTRASQELYVFIPSKVGNTVNPAKFLIPEEVLSLGTPSDASESLRPIFKETHWKIKPFTLNPWTGLKEKVLDHDLHAAAWAHRGQFIHAMLSCIERLTEGSNDSLWQEAWDAACSTLIAPKDKEQALKDMRDFVNRPDVRPFFYLPSDSKVLCEQEFVDALGITRRIDRLVVWPDVVWVVDFKWSLADQADHQKQMQGYIALIKQFYPKHKVWGHILYLYEGG